MQGRLYSVDMQHAYLLNSEAQHRPISGMVSLYCAHYQLARATGPYLACHPQMDNKLLQ